MSIGSEGGPSEGGQIYRSAGRQTERRGVGGGRRGWREGGKGEVEMEVMGRGGGGGWAEEGGRDRGEKREKNKTKQRAHRM